jgi:hypothetical protein
LRIGRAPATLDIFPSQSSNNRTDLPKAEISRSTMLRVSQVAVSSQPETANSSRKGRETRRSAAK